MNKQRLLLIGAVLALLGLMLCFVDFAHDGKVTEQEKAFIAKQRELEAKMRPPGSPGAESPKNGSFGR